MLAIVAYMSTSERVSTTLLTFDGSIEGTNRGSDRREASNPIGNWYPSVIDLQTLRGRYAVPMAALQDLAARRRAGAHDIELISLLVQPDWGGLSNVQASRLLTEFPNSK
jgi:hypothetical protein